MDTPTHLLSLLDIRDELRRDVCQLTFLDEAICALISDDIEREIIEGISYSMHHVLSSLNQIDDRLERINRTLSGRCKVLINREKA